MHAKLGIHNSMICIDLSNLQILVQQIKGLIAFLLLHFLVLKDF